MGLAAIEALGLTPSLDVIRLDEATDIMLWPPTWYSWRLLTYLAIAPRLLVLVWEVGLLLWADALDPRLSQFLVGKLLHALQTTVQEILDGLLVPDLKRSILLSWRDWWFIIRV